MTTAVATAFNLDAAIEAVPFVKQGPLWVRTTSLPCWLFYRADCRPYPIGCRQCGATINSSRRAYCSAKCSSLFQINHFWSTARAHAILKALPGYTLRDYLESTWKYDISAERPCARCGDLKKRWSFEVNHIRPVNGDRDFFSCHHHQSNLEAVCHDCHVEITNQQRRSGLIGPPRPVPTFPLFEGDSGEPTSRE